MSEADLILAIPSKGRLMEAAEEYFSEAGLKVERLGGIRRYQGSLKGIGGIEVRFLSAGEIASGLIAGEIHLGITGRDLLHEKIREPDSLVVPLSALKFGHADVVVAVPQAWLDVETMADLVEVSAEIRTESGRILRVATKFTNMTRQFFAAHGIADYRIVESLGATEGAPAAGTAEIIVDITSTGATLTANQLKILKDGVILNSEAFLCASLGASWSDKRLASVEDILGRLAARQRAKNLVEVRSARKDLSKVDLAKCMSTFDAEFAFGYPDTNEQEIVVLVSNEDQQGFVMALKELGANVITARKADYIYSASNPLYENLVRNLTPKITR
jgi:ATP phosphoribosyltransferase